MRCREIGLGLAALIAMSPALRADPKPKRAPRDAKPAETAPADLRPAEPADPFPILMPQETAEQALAKIRALTTRYRLPGDSAGEKRRVVVLLESLVGVCRDFEEAFPKHPELDWVRATHMEAYIQLSYFTEPPQAMIGAAARISQMAANESGMMRQHPLAQLTQLRQQIANYGKTIGSLGNFRDENLAKRNQVVAQLLRYADKYPRQPGVAGLLLEFGRLFHQAEMPAQAGNMLRRIIKNYPGGWEAEEAAKVLEQVKLSTNPVALKFTDAVGKEFDLASHRGHVTILFFWSPEQAGNKNLAARVAALLERFASDGLAAVSIARGEEEVWKSALEGGAPAWPQYLDHADDGKSAAAVLGVVRTPMFVLIDHNGMLKQATEGPNLEAEVFHLVSVQRSKK